MKITPRVRATQNGKYLEMQRILQAVVDSIDPEELLELINEKKLGENVVSTEWTLGEVKLGLNEDWHLMSSKEYDGLITRGNKYVEVKGQYLRLNKKEDISNIGFKEDVVHELILKHIKEAGNGSPGNERDI